jgi:ABC-2 type transport system ATP-binding protein
MDCMGSCIRVETAITPVTTPAIVAQQLTKRFGRTIAVDHIDLEIPRGSVCGLAGVNGAGKTTTISMLLGLLAPTRGSLRVLDLDPVKQSFELRQRIGYVPERHYIYEWMRVRHVLSLTRGVYPTWDKHRCAELIDYLKLPMNRSVKQLSKGELAKLALVIGLSHDADLLILDEPTSGLDPIARRELLSLIQQMVRRRTCTVLFSSHILSDIERLADRIIVLDQGKVVANGSLDDLRSRYVRASLFFRTPPEDETPIPEALRVERSLREWVVTFRSMEETRIREIAEGVGADDCFIQPATLDDVFFEIVKGQSAEVRA